MRVLPDDMRPGAMYGSLTVLFYFDSDHVLAMCACGGEKVVQAASMRRGLTRSCGCGRKGRPLGDGRCRSPEYAAWSAAKGRVLNPRDAAYPHYGGRGITMAPEWIASFDRFLEHIGPKPSPELSLDRIDNDGGYVPGNVRWATPAEQTANRRSAARVAMDLLNAP